MCIYGRATRVEDLSPGLLGKKENRSKQLFLSVFSPLKQSRAVFCKDLSHSSHLKVISRLTAIPCCKMVFPTDSAKGQKLGKSQTSASTSSTSRNCTRQTPQALPCSLPLYRIWELSTLLHFTKKNMLTSRDISKGSLMAAGSRK